MDGTRPTASAAQRLEGSNGRPITGEELWRMPDPGPCELVEGRIVPMSPPGWKHGSLVSRIDRRLGRFVEQRGLGEVLGADVGIYTAYDPDTVRGADVAFISTERLGRVASKSYLDVAPELVVEVISPTSRWREMRRKIDEYFGAGVERVWIVEPERRQVLVYSAPSEFRTLGTDDRLEGEGALDGFSVAIEELFG